MYELPKHDQKNEYLVVVPFHKVLYGKENGMLHNL